MKKRQTKKSTDLTWDDRQWRLMGNWEPKMFLKRRGDTTFWDINELWETIHSDKAITRMKTLGINLSHIHFHKGYGLEHEKKSITEAKHWAKRLHENGIRVGVYIGATFFWETFKHPDYEKMIMHNTLAGWNSEQYFRTHWCYNSPKSRDYFREVIRTAIDYVKADVLHFDLSFSFYHDQLCHCEFCLKAFRDFIKKEIPEIVGIAGYEDLKHLSPPPAGNGIYLGTVQSLKEPGAIAWALFHAQAGARALEYFAQYAKSLKKDIIIMYNGGNLCGIHPFCRADMEIEKLHQADIAFVEDSLENPVLTTAAGMPVSRFRPYKVGNHAKTRIFYYTTEHNQNNRLMLAEAAAFNYRSLGCVEVAMQKHHRLEKREDLKFIQYLLENEKLFLGQEQWCHTGVLRHHESQLLNPFPSGLSPYVIEQLLFEAHQPFAILSERDLKRDILKKLRLLILPDCRCLKETEIAEIEAFVRGGGRLLSIGNTATANYLNQYRPVWGLSALFGLRAEKIETTASYDEVAVSTNVMKMPVTNAAGKYFDVRYGKGRAVHIPEIEFNLPDRSKMTRFGHYEWYYHPYWQPPKNTGKILKSLCVLLGDDYYVETDVPRHVGVEYYAIANGYRIHFVNFKHPAPVEKFKLTITLHCIPTVGWAAYWHAPEGAKELNSKMNGNGRLQINPPAFELIGTLTLRV